MVKKIIKGLTGIVSGLAVAFSLTGNVKASGLLNIKNYVDSSYSDIKLVHYNDAKISDDIDSSWDNLLLEPPQGISGIYSEINNHKLVKDYRLPSSDTPFNIRLIYNGTINSLTHNHLEFSMPYGPEWEFKHKNYLSFYETDSSENPDGNSWDIRDIIANHSGVINLEDLSPGNYNPNVPYAFFKLDFEPIIPEFTGDINNDGYVNDFDLNLFLSNYNNGYDNQDLGVLLGNFGKTPSNLSSLNSSLSSGAQAVPEPYGLGMMAVGGGFLGYVLRKKRKDKLNK